MRPSTIAKLSVASAGLILAGVAVFVMRPNPDRRSDISEAQKLELRGGAGAPRIGLPNFHGSSPEPLPTAASERNAGAIRASHASSFPRAKDLEHVSLPDLWALYEPGAGSDSQTRSTAANRLSRLLAELGDAPDAIRDRIARYVLDETTDEGERIAMVRILGESDTPSALATLLEAAQSTQNSRLYRSILEQLSRMGSPRTPEQATTMSAVAMGAWSKVSEGDLLHGRSLDCLARIIAKLGEPEGIVFLRAEAVLGGSTVAELNTAGTPASISAMNSSLMVRAEAAGSVELLATSLLKNDPSSTEFIWSGQGLIAMGRPEGTSAVITWAQSAPDSCAEVAGAWLSSVRDSRSQALLREMNETGRNRQFRSAAVRDAVLAASARFARQ